MSDMLTFLSDPATREVLSWLGGGVVVLAGGAWAVIKFFLSKDEEASEPPGAPSVRAKGQSIAAGRDVTVYTSHGLSGRQVVLIVLGVVGGLLLAGGLFGDRITAIGSAVTGGNVTNSTIIINGGAKGDAD